MSLNRFNKADLPHCEEITRDACIASFLTDEGLCDITLKGKDGVSVNANRFWLAARSRVFRSMLLGEFSEAKKDVIPLGYNGCVLKALVEYIVTDRALVLENEGQESDGELVSLMAAAMFFELPGLCEKAFDNISRTLRKQPSSSVAILEACQKEGPAVPTQLKRLAISNLVSNLDTLDQAAVSFLSAESVEEILKCDTTKADEFCLFEVLLNWVKGKKDTVNDEYTEPRETIASQLVKKYIRLDWIDPELLGTSAKSSSFVPQELLLEAFQKQALAAKQEHKVVFKRARNSFVWSNSLTEMSSAPVVEGDDPGSDSIGCPQMTTGVHEWTLELVEKSRGDYVGICLGNIDKSKYLGSQKGGCVLTRWKKSFRNGKDESDGHPIFDQGSRITLTLNLLPNEERNGTLHVSVNGGEPSLVFDNLREELPSSNDGFVPAVSNYSGGTFRLVRIERFV